MLLLFQDLKPKNLFILNSNRIALGDFGCAKLMVNDSCSTIIGTPLYMAPEMLCGTQYDEKIDIWALGVVLYELIELRLPFNSKVNGK